MKTEFLQNLKVGDQPLSKEVIDANTGAGGLGTPSWPPDAIIRADAHARSTAKTGKSF